MNVHIIQDGVVVNTIVVDSLELAQELFPEATVVDADVAGSKGDTYDFEAGTFAPAPVLVVVPEAVTMRQARLALLATGALAGVQSTIAAMEGELGDKARIEWEFSSEVRRTQPLVLALAPALGLTEQQLDELFILAETL